MQDGVYENPRRVDLVRRELAQIDKLFDFSDDVIGRGGHHGIEVARGLAVDEIAPAVAFPGFDEGEVTADGALEDVGASVEIAGFLAFGNHGAVTSGRVERGDACAAGAEAFGQGALRIQLDLQLAAQDQLLEEFIFANVSGNHFFDLAILQEDADAEVVDAGIVADDGEILGAFAADGSDEVFGDAAEAEASHEDRGTISEVGDGGVGAGDPFIHGKGPLASWKTAQAEACATGDAVVQESS